MTSTAPSVDEVEPTTLSILGPLEVTVGGVRVDIAGRKERVVLAVLAGSPGEAVSTDRIADAVWGDDLPRAAPKAIQNLILRLRKLLGSDVIETRHGGYCLSVPSDRVDAHRFEHLVMQGREHVTSGALRAAVSSFEAALDLWRGPALPELEGTRLLSAHRSRLEELRRSAWEEAAEVGLALDGHREWVTTLETMVADEPLRERRWELLVLALHRCGRQADALRAYQRARSALAEAGLEPGHALRSVEQAVARNDGSLTTTAVGHAAEALPTGVVTFLLTDIDESTEMWDASPVAMVESLEAHDALVENTVEGHHGVVIRSRGEGDSTLSVFHRASDALDAAIELQVALETRDWPEGLRFRSRMAVHSGEAQLRGRDYYGGAVNRAVRIRGLASGGQIFVSQVTRDLVADVLPEDVDLVRLGALELEGLRRAETVYSVSAPGIVEGDAAAVVTAAEARMGRPLPALLAVAASAPFCGRGRELQLLTEGFASVAAGTSRTVLISGEPGVGKTRLVAEAAAMAHSEGAIVLYGRCDDAIAVPFQPFAEALGSTFERAVADADGDQYRLFERVSDAMKELASSQALVVVVDDLHWATKPTLLLLRHVVRSTVGAAVMVSATFRDTDTETALADTLADLRRLDTVDRLALDGLDELGVASMLERFGRPDGDDTVAVLASTLVERTNGNPFFLNEVLRDLDESGAIVRSPSGWRWSADDGIGLPLGVREVLEQRLTRLGDAAHHVLRCAAISGREVRLDVVMTAADCDEATALDAFDAASASRLVRELGPDRFRFAHALVQSTLTDSIGPSRRVRLHRRIAEYLEQAHPDDLYAIANHWLESATVADPHRTVQAVFSAAHHADESGAIDDAADLFERLVELDLGSRLDEETRREIALRHAIASHRAGRERGWQLLADVAWSAHAAGDAARLGQAVAARTRGAWGSVIPDDEKIALQRAALDVIGIRPSESRTRILLELGADLVLREPLEARRLFAEADAMARLLDDAGLRGEMLVTSYWIHWTDTEWEDAALALLDDVSGPRGDRWQPPALLTTQFNIAVNRGDLSRAARLLAVLEERAEQGTSASDRYAILLHKTCLASLAGRLTDADTLNRQQREYGRRTNRPGAGGFYSILDHTMARDEGRVAGIVDRALEIDPIIPLGMASYMRAHAASYLVDEGRLEEAGQLVADQAASGMRLARDAIALSSSYAYALSEAVAALEDQSSAAALLAIMAPWSGRVVFDAIQCYGPIDRSLGRLATVVGHFDDADRYLTAAESQCAHIGAPLFRARTWADQARLVLRRGGDGHAAESLVARAVAVADELHAPGVARYARSTIEAR